MKTDLAYFESALPVWQAGAEHEKNYTLVFKQEIHTQNAILRISGQSSYQIFANGCFIAYGPARTAHGYHCIDEIDLSNHLPKAGGLISILTYCANTACYAYANSPAFLCAEIIADGKVIAATGGEGFCAERYLPRLQFTPRFSLQRAFTEVYQMQAEDDTYLTSCSKNRIVELAVQPERRFIQRTAPYCEYERCTPLQIIDSGLCTLSEEQAERIWPEHETFKPEEMQFDPVPLARRIRCASQENTPKCDPYYLYDFGQELTGFVSVEINVLEPTKLLLLFDEILLDGRVDFERLVCNNVMTWLLQPGRYHLLSMEPNSFRYLNAVVLGQIDFIQVCLYRYDFPMSHIRWKPALENPQHQKILDAAIETFRQNASDIFMDCPSRERAGWLCDSFFTGRAEFALTGKSTIEQAFLMTFILPEKFDYLPEGMLPMCYPADHPNGRFIPNWAMWFVLELEEYLHRSGDRALVDAARERIEALVQYFVGFENEDGLLENLASWVFVEWSRANDLVQDVNYPSNMLYCAFLKSIARLYNLPEYAEKAARISAEIRRQAIKGCMFADHALRKNGILEVQNECTETCQYYAFFTGVATFETDRELLDRMIHEFGPKRDCLKTYPDVAPSNAFIGNYLRLELLEKCGLSDQIMENIVDYFFPMAETTGTLWEHNTSTASCNHGFASSVVWWMKRILSDKP